MSTNKQRRTSKERFWRKVIRQWGGSDLSARAFCAEQGLSEASFYAWRRTLGQRDGVVGFLPVQVTPESKPPVTADGSAGAVELVLATGRRLRIGPGFDGPTLARLLALLEEGRL